MIHRFQIIEKLHETRRSVVYRATRAGDAASVVLKMLNSEYPTPRGLARYRQEYEIIRSLDAPGVIRASGLDKLGNSVVIVLEDFGGSALDLLFQRERPALEQLLDMAIQAAAALGRIHEQGVIHRDVNPSNMVWNGRTGQLKIIDFGIATRLSSESPALKEPGVLEGTLPYISPEQTGRMNRRVDYRTDFYSLGASLYELLTGRPPFERADALELIHCHIAAQPRPPAELREDVPPVLSRIIMKLLAKTAEERYQSAAGLVSDLERCRALVRAGERAAVFPLGRDDVSDRFAIPQKLYGRARETGVLLDAFERVAQGRCECVLVTGYSGIGKSSLVRELYRPITRRSAFFVSGKFDLLQRATPYSALSATLSALVKQLVTRSQDELERWRDALLGALGPNGRLLIDLIPELELVIGAQPAVEELGPVEAQNRLSLAFSSFLRVFARPAHPLVIFLDDLQWVDAATLKLLEPMMSDEELSHFLLIGAYRDNEVDAAHPLSATLDGLEERGVATSAIHLQPLGLEDMVQMLADTLASAPAAARPLAELVLRRTGGNPFFVSAFLKTLHDDGLLRFDAQSRAWRWDMAAIEATSVTDSVAALLTPKLRSFPEETRELLRLAACMGSSFDLDTLAIIADRARAEIAGALLAAIREGYIHAASDPELVIADGQEPELLIRQYRFAHDRVQQAAYALIPAQQRAAIHLDIGRLLLARLGPEEREERLFELVDHLNLGRSLLDASGEDGALTRVALARLDLAAARRAREAAAYAAASGYLAIGLELCGDAWDEHHELALALHTEGAMVEYCHGDYERSQALIATALGKTQSVALEARLYQILIVEHTNQGKHAEAFRVAREVLELLGQPLPEEHEIEAALAEELERIRQLLGDRPIESLIDDPEVGEETYRVAIEIVGELAPTAYQVAPALYPMIPARMVRLMLEHGQSVMGGLGYSAYGHLLGAMFGDYQRGYRFGALALRVADRFHSPAAKAKAGELMSGHIYAWTRPLAGFLPINAAAFEAALQSGELQYAGFNLYARMVNYFRQGVSLDRVLDEARGYLQFARRSKNVAVANVMQGYRIVAAHLAGETHDDVPDLDADAEFVATCRQQNSFLSLACYFPAKCLALYLRGEYERALEAAVEAETLAASAAGTMAVVDGVFYHALCLAALYPQAAPERQRELRQGIEARLARLETWAESCPENFRHLHLLAGAELARVTGDPLVAMERYLQAIEHAEQGEMRHDAALSNELAARFFQARGQARYAILHMRDARYGYALWGARRKAAMLEAEHGQLLVHPRQDAPPSTETTHGSTRPTSASSSEQLDLASVIKASQAMSSEISLDKLLARLIQIVIESAGAQHGYLILQRRDRLAIEARGTLGDDDIEVLSSLPLDGGAGAPARVSTAIVHYVLRTRETVVLHDAVHEGPFVSDPYVIATSPRSILCMPLLNQGNVSGVVYLENNLSPQAFTPARVELLALLSSQMAISLDNSLLYGNLQRASRDLERLLYSIAHDLKEPLRTVQSFSELLVRRQAAQIDDRGRDYLARIIQAGQRLGDLLEAIRTISKIRRIDGPHQPVPGERLVHDAIQRLQPEILQTGAIVRVSGELPKLAVDPRWGAEALYQLVQNSLHHAADGPAPEIEIEPYDGSEGLGFVVKDRGAGIPEEYAESMFDLFRRAVGREVPGTGAGLAIVRQIAAKHGGNAWLRPRAGGGTEVYVTFG